jgi:hypothetical protein
MEATLERRNRTQRINYYVSTLKRSQPEMLEQGLKTIYLRAMAYLEKWLYFCNVSFKNKRQWHLIKFM